MYVKELWRYPIKSMAGERIQRTQVGSQGFAGDRQVLVWGPNGRVLTARRHFRLLGLKGTLGADGQARIDGYLWNSPEALTLVREAAGPGAQVFFHDGPDRFDVLPLLVTTDGALAAFGHDRRRLRPNIIIGGVQGLAERTWPGKYLRMGEVVIGVQDRRARCVMTTYHPDTLEQDPDILRSIVEKFDGELALNCHVVRGGEIGMGDSVTLISDWREDELSTGADLRTKNGTVNLLN